MVNYLESDIAPPNWIALAKHTLEYSTPPNKDLPFSWLHPYNAKDTKSEDKNTNKIEKNKIKPYRHHISMNL